MINLPNDKFNLPNDLSKQGLWCQTVGYPLKLVSLSVPWGTCSFTAFKAVIFWEHKVLVFGWNSSSCTILSCLVLYIWALSPPKKATSQWFFHVVSTLVVKLTLVYLDFPATFKPCCPEIVTLCDHIPIALIIHFPSKWNLCSRVNKDMPVPSSI